MGNVINQIVDFVRSIAPLLPILRQIIPGLDDRIEQIVHGIESEGAEFIVRNDDTFAVIKEVGEILSDVGSSLFLVGDLAPRYAADGELTEEELRSLVGLIELNLKSQERLAGLPKLAAGLKVS